MQDLLSFESCRSSAVDFFEERSPESPRKMQDEQEVTSETSWNATRRKEVDEWRLEPEGNRRRQKPKFYGTGWKAFSDRMMAKVAMRGCK